MWTMALSSWIKKIKKAWALSIAVAVHVLLLLIFGGYVLFKGSVPRMPFTSQDVPAGEEISDAPPSEAPPEDPSESMSSTEVTETTTTEPLETDLIATSSSLAPPPPMPASLPQPPAAAGATSGKMPSFRGGGGGRGGGKGSAVNFFGVRGSGVNIAFVIDASESMVQAERGRIVGYARLKERVEGMISALDSETVFNVVVFSAGGAERLFSQPEVASSANVSSAKTFIQKFNLKEDINFIGVKGNGNYQDVKLPPFGFPVADKDPKTGKELRITTRMDLGLMAALEGLPDTVFIISDGKAPGFRQLEGEIKPSADGVGDPSISEEQRERHARAVAEYRRDLETYAEANRRFLEKYKDLLAEEARLRQEVVKKGIGKKIVEGKGVVYDYSKAKVPGLPEPKDRPQQPDPPVPPKPKSGSKQVEEFMGKKFLSTGKILTEDELISRIREVIKAYYEKNGMSLPSIHTVGYMSAENEKRFLEKLAKRNNGTYKQITAPLPKDDAG